MNSVQTNIMNIAPAPNAATKTTNAAEAVRPTSQTGATAERGAKNPSFVKALAKLKAAKQDVADMAEAVAKDPLAASLAASGQTQAKPADAADGESSTEAVQGVQTVEESAPVQVSAKERRRTDAGGLVGNPCRARAGDGRACLDDKSDGRSRSAGGKRTFRAGSAAGFFARDRRQRSETVRAAAGKSCRRGQSRSSAGAQ